MKKWEDFFREDDFIKDLTQLLKIPSVESSTTNNDEQPFGETIHKALEFMLVKGKEEGLSTYNHKGFYGYIEYGPKEADNYIAIPCHVDVMPGSKNWNGDPFKPYIKNNKVIARGAIDDKGPTMAAWYALKMLNLSGAFVKHRIRLIIGTNEESGMKCMKSYTANEPEPLFAFAPDAEFPIINAEKGQINIRLHCKPKQPVNSIQLISFNAGDRGNMVPDKAVAVIGGTLTKEFMDKIKQFEAYGDVFIKIINDSEITIKTTGISAHGMEPDKGTNAAFKLSSILRSIEELSFHPYLSFINTYLKDDFYGNNLGIEFSDSITGKLTVNAGVFTYDFENGGEITLNIRCPVKTPYEQTITQLEELSKQKGWIISQLRTTSPHHVDASHKGIKALIEAYEKVAQSKATLLSTGGATYARFFKEGVAYGAVFPGKQNTAHQKNEFADLDDLKTAAHIYAEALCRLGNM